MADVKLSYAASSDLTVTNLHALASSATWVGVWESGAVDNTTNEYLDYLISGKITVESAGLAAGEIRVGIVAMIDDTNWPDVFDGTESTETITDTEIRDAIVKIGASIVTDTTASRVYPFGPFSVAQLFGGICPAKFVVVVAQSTGANLETSGNQVTVKGVFVTVG